MNYLFPLWASLLLATTSLAPTESTSPAFGSGIFGSWFQDEFGMPGYFYTMRYNDPSARWKPGIEPETSLMWHQLGNDRLTATAFNLGFVQLFYAESGALWLNEYEPQNAEHAGGFGWLIDGQTVLIDRDDMIPDGASWERIFGLGYFRKRLELNGLTFDRFLFCPVEPPEASRLLPLIISEITLTNSTPYPKDVVLIEYWDVNMRLLTAGLLGRGVGPPASSTRMKFNFNPAEPGLLRLQPHNLQPGAPAYPGRPCARDPVLPSLLLRSPDRPPDAWITDPAELFNGSTLITDPHRLRSAGTTQPRASLRSQRQTCLAARISLRLPPHSERTLHFEFGYEKQPWTEEMMELLESAAALDSRRLPSPDVVKMAPASLLTWAQALPRLSLPTDPWLGRELAWNYYYLMSSVHYDAYFQAFKIPQGGNYLYYSGMDGAARDYAAFVLTCTYYRPELAREILKFMMRAQDRDGRLFYDIAGYGKRYNTPYRPGDLDLWFLWALAEYVFATRDFDLLTEEEPYYPRHTGESGPGWDHARRSFFHLRRIIGTGPHGHLRLRLSDWNDEMMWLTAGSNPLDMLLTFHRGESVMNTALACYVLPLFAELARGQGDSEAAKEAEDFLAELRRALASAWHEDHLIRAYSGLGRPFGQEEIYLEPQVWALLAAGALPPEQEKILLDTILRRLKEPSALGMMISTSTSGSLTTRPGEQEEGGIWFAINGPAVVALARFDPVLAWEELKRNTLGWHAERYPEIWFGIWSGPDAWNSVFSARPGETWFMKTPLFNTGPQMYPLQNAHAHAQTMWAAARLAGIQPTASGWIIEARIPTERYEFECALYSLEVSPKRMRGELRLPTRAEMEVRVRRPAVARGGKVMVFADGQGVPFQVEDDYFVFVLSAGPENPAKWEIREEVESTELDLKSSGK